jgi:hypothetical protein
MELGSLSCPVCSTHFDSSSHEPRFFPSCGHNLCVSCLGNLLKNVTDTIPCPCCQADVKIKKKNIAYFPKNWPLISLIEKRNSQQICQTHHTHIEMICLECKEKICSKCALKGNHKGHDIDVIHDFVAEIDNKVGEIDQWTDHLTVYLENVEKAFEERKHGLINEVECKFNTYIGMLLMKKDSVVEEINSFFSGIMEQNIFKLKEELVDMSRRWRNEQCFDAAFKIFSEDLKAIYSEVRKTLSVDFKDHVEDKLYFVKLRYDDDFSQKVDELCSFGEFLTKKIIDTDDEVGVKKQKLNIFVKSHRLVSPIQVCNTDLISDLKAKIQAEVGIPADQLWLSYGINNLLDHRKVFEYDIVNDSTLNLRVRSGLYHMNIRTLEGEKLGLNVRNNLTVSELKKEIETLRKIPIEKQNLSLYTGVQLQDEKHLRDYLFAHESTILLTV